MGTWSRSPTNSASTLAHVVLGERSGRGGRDHLALGVVGRGGDAEAHRGVVRLVGEHQVAEQTGGAVDPDHEHARGHRVEGPGVADLAGAGQPPDPGHDVVGGDPGRLVDDDEPGLSHPRLASVVDGRVLVGGDLARLLVRVLVPGVRRAALRRDRLVQLTGLGQHLVEVARRLRQRVGHELQGRACRMPSCLATSDRIMPLADSSAAPVAASAASSVCSPTRPRAPCRRSWRSGCRR